VGGSRERDGPARSRERGDPAAVVGSTAGEEAAQAAGALDKELSAFNEERCALSPF
jgi:hypothetical protein